METQRRRCEICNIDVHRSSFAKHLRSEKHKENERIIPSWLFIEEEQRPQRITRITQVRVPTLRELAMNQIQLPKKELEKEIARRMLNP